MNITYIFIQDRKNQSHVYINVGIQRKKNIIKVVVEIKTSEKSNWTSDHGS